ncbi:hypothetical protein EV191_101937 [Tamaricihabitans halophyticus]|uniref:Uncharacterized protein n=1 Tax=Tamaricihabitans halophyticus TaxID=1262583 RepID=A0A4R2R4Q6_9PSEU|nr:hypothetical protein [Tamaricihabitans halophyticus]TCP56987.1 hypothetical protein EV191_101937 [Tamaricihabitans halophyticus]
MKFAEGNPQVRRVLAVRVDSFVVEQERDDVMYELEQVIAEELGDQREVDSLVDAAEAELAAHDARSRRAWLGGSHRRITRSRRRVEQRVVRGLPRVSGSEAA